ncbi:uncharacterized protein LOC117899554 [Drosophila subobscura]|uniref:uncharacterized protein LOC117899554 n=1 Tax=Drosophila subobscura TaxID=7241 RepID=UPI00155A5745|nr:uncharacterized protein LOC117899554 [Drosophila subobscura]
MSQEDFRLPKVPGGKGDGGVSPDDKDQPSWMAWVERNAKPRVRVRPKVERELTPWQKAGPMKKKDWQRFYEWASSKAMPKELPEAPPREIPCEADYLPCGKPKAADEDDLDMLEKMEKLSIPLARRQRKVHQYVYPVNAYNPMIVWGQQPRPDKGRPFDPPHVPCCFPNSDIEDEFWATLRFPVRKQALKGRPSPRIVSLARPKVMPPWPPHCAIPPRTVDPLDVPPPKRKKFTAQAWRLHQIRLLYLSRPVSRREFEYFYL